MPPADLSRDELLVRLREAEETLNAIRNGEVDAVVVGGPTGHQVYTLESVDRPYRVLIEQMQEGAVTLDAEGVILYANESFADIVHVRRTALIGRPVRRFFPDGAFERLMNSRGPDGSSGELTLVAANGGTVPVKLSLIDLASPDLPHVICGVVTDLSQLHRRRNELAAANAELAAQIEERRLAEESLQLALDAAGMGNWQLDLVTGRTQRSLRHDQIFGYPDGTTEWGFERALSHFLPADRTGVEAALAQAEATGAFGFEARIQRGGDDEMRWIRIDGRVYREGGKPVRLAGVVSDVTERRALEEQLRQSQKMEAVGQLTGGLAHDFNNLLTGITGSLELLRGRLARGRLDDAERYIAAAQGASTRAASLTHRLLAFSRRQTLEPKPTACNRLILDMEELIRRTIGPAIDFDVVSDTGLWSTLVDPNQLENAVLNLCINARDAMPAGGKLTAETANRWLDERAARDRELPPGGYVVLSITDTGVGMTRDVVERAFDPFFTTKPLGKGTGLGLSMIYGFARQSNGQVRIYSELHRGTTVSIFLPRFFGKSEQPAPAAEPAQPGRAEQGETVLVVDDEPTIRMLIAEILQDFGYTALVVDNGHDAVKILRSDSRIDLLITDVGLPGGINGRQVAEAGVAERPGLRVLFITGYAENAVLNHGHLEPGMRVLTKPFSTETLARRIRELVGPG